jgi:hypothetical protein
VAAFLVALVPSAGVLLVFWIGIRALVQADRRERAAQARIEAAERLANSRGVDPAHSAVPAPPMAARRHPSPPAGPPP